MSSEAKRIIGLYERHAESFDKDRGRALFETPWLERFLALVPRGASILDLGCGTSEPIARYFVERGYAVTGVDSSPSMIGFCSSRFPGQTWVVADMRALSLARRFHGILAWDSLFHLTPDDQWAMFPVFRQHAVQGTALMFTSGPGHGVAVGAYQGEPLYHASLGGDEYRSLLNENGFDLVANALEDVSCGGHTVWLARRS
jgi:SAM-dependent methyltransferase